MTELKRLKRRYYISGCGLIISVAAQYYFLTNNMYREALVVFMFNLFFIFALLGIALYTKCPSCRKRLDIRSNAKFCPNCGVDLTKGHL